MQSKLELLLRYDLHTHYANNLQFTIFSIIIFIFFTNVIYCANEGQFNSIQR